MEIYGESNAARDARQDKKKELASRIHLANDCHDPESGRFCEVAGHPKSAVNGPDEVPLPPGETPLPPGTFRAFHYSATTNTDSIREKGLSLGAAKGQTYGEGTGLWFDGGFSTWGDVNDPTKVLVEVALPEDIHIVNGGQQGAFVIAEDVPPSRILALHQAWHTKYRYFVDNDMTEEVKAGDHDGVADYPDYGPAIEKIKRTFTSATTDTERTKN